MIKVKRISTGKIILIGSLILAVFITLPLLYNHFFEIKPKILPPLVQKKEVSIIGISVEPPDNVTFYTDGVMTDTEKKLMVESFLTAVVIPEQDLWVNLKVNEQNSIAQFYLGRTELGRVMLEQDLLLKKATSTAYYPEREPGNTFWLRIGLYGQDRRTASEIRSWIFPKQVVIKDNGREMFIKLAELDVKQERIKEGIGGFQDASDELILPAVKKYVLEDENFIPTRQVFRAVVCGIWFKNKFLRTIYTYCINTNKTGYFEIADSQMKYRVWDKYITSFREHDYLDAEVTGNRIWGGVTFETPAKWVEVKKEDTRDDLKDKDRFTFQVKPSTIPNSVNTESGTTVEKLGGIDFNTRIEVEEDTFPISDTEAREWQLSESIGYDLLK
jgi:hypothetical protein